MFVVLDIQYGPHAKRSVAADNFSQGFKKVHALPLRPIGAGKLVFPEPMEFSVAVKLQGLHPGFFNTFPIARSSGIADDRNRIGAWQRSTFFYVDNHCRLVSAVFSVSFSVPRCRSLPSSAAKSLP